MNQKFPPLLLAGGGSWPLDTTGAAPVEEREGESATGEGGYLLVAMRGSFCADSRAQLLQLASLQTRLDRLGVQLVLVSTEAPEHWHHWWPGKDKPKVLQLDAHNAKNEAFIAPAGVPLWLRLTGRLLGMRGPASAAACRPSAWLLDDEGYIVWRHLPANYRMPGSGDFFLGQVSRLGD
ncbi:hypothetical protein [Microbulbifer guangxiensis]|uniref:hypothetical protein n=1 Tax=Microbulbifer guangxiensis TaxID=2904249 RepID=UPI001F3A562E|nr:hypothetical protein [Microbulbifer guangxiensis]